MMTTMELSRRKKLVSFRSSCWQLTIVFFLLASASADLHASTCKRQNAMKGKWSVLVNGPMTFDWTNFSNSRDAKGSVVFNNTARLSLLGEFIFNTRSTLTSGKFNDVQLDLANSLQILEYDRPRRGLRLNRTARYTSNNKKVTSWTKRKNRCYGTATFLLEGRDYIDGNIVFDKVICTVDYRLDRSAHNAHIGGTCRIDAYDPIDGDKAWNLAPVSGSMIKKF